MSWFHAACCKLLTSRSLVCFMTHNFNVLVHSICCHYFISFFFFFTKQKSSDKPTQHHQPGTQQLVNEKEERYFFQVLVTKTNSMKSEYQMETWMSQVAKKISYWGFNCEFEEICIYIFLTTKEAINQYVLYLPLVSLTFFFFFYIFPLVYFWIVFTF